VRTETSINFEKRKTKYVSTCDIKKSGVKKGKKIYERREESKRFFSMKEKNKVCSLAFFSELPDIEFLCSVLSFSVS
jgi:hypothetical protein